MFQCRWLLDSKKNFCFKKPWEIVMEVNLRGWDTAKSTLLVSSFLTALPET